MAPGMKRDSLQKQIHFFLMAIVSVACIQAVFYWGTIHKLWVANRETSKISRAIDIADNIERNLYKDIELKRGIIGPNESKALNKIKTEFKQDLESLTDLVDDKKQINLFREIENEFDRKTEASSNQQLLILIRSFIAGERSLLLPHQKVIKDGTKVTAIFVCATLLIFTFATILLSNFLKNNLFEPLNRLTAKMHTFQAGNHELPPRNPSNNELGRIESQFYEMASRITDTVSELQDLDKVKTDFISIASHELRTPMTSVKGSLSLILSGSMENVSDEVKEVLQIAEQETDRLIRLINDILDLTKMEAKKLPLTKKWTLLSDVIESAVKGLTGLYEATKVTVEFDPTIAFPVRVMMDRDRIQQVITNLLSNAVKFSPAGSTVRIMYEVVGQQVTVSIIDQGPGIKSEEQSHVFEKFRSHDAGKSKIIKGTGLGLPICKALVEQHGGTIGLTSEYGKGCTFYFTLPQVEIVSRFQEMAA